MPLPDDSALQNARLQRRHGGKQRIHECSQPGEFTQGLERSLRAYFTELGGVSPGALYTMVHREVDAVLLKLALELAGENQSEAASLLGLARTTFRAKLSRLDA